MRVLGIVVFVLVSAARQAAAEDTGCDKFAWPLQRERAQFAAPDKVKVVAGAELAALPSAAVILSLQPATQASYLLPPERKPKFENWFGGALRFPAPEKAGSYQVTLSQEAWIDVVQDGRYARSIGSSGRSDCTGLRKSVRFELNATPFVIQLSGVTSEAIVVGISRSE